MLARSNYSDNKMTERFLAKYDTSQDSHLDEFRLRATFEELGAHFLTWRAERALNVADKDRDGHISLSELSDLLDYAIKRGYKIQ